MNKSILALSLFILLNNISLVRADEKVASSHLQQIESLQRRADKLAFGGLGADNYYIAKARTWLDLALGRYYGKDDDEVIPAAIEQAQTLLNALEKGQADMLPNTPMKLKGGEAVRPDLWDKIAALKSHAKFSCGQRQVGEAEVQLVWTGLEKAEYGWSHAESYARNVEDRIYEAGVAIKNCAGTENMVPPENMAPLAQPCKTDCFKERITLMSDAQFKFGEAMLNPSALWRLDRLADNIKTMTTLEKIMLVGHTDRLRTDRHQERNQLLSEQRAESIKQYLTGKGIPADKIQASGAGSSQPLVQCSTRQNKKKQIACLEPNRRVEITLSGTR